MTRAERIDAAVRHALGVLIRRRRGELLANVRDAYRCQAMLAALKAEVAQALERRAA